MKWDRVAAGREGARHDAPVTPPTHRHIHGHVQSLSRRQFLQRTAGGAVIGAAAVGAAGLRPGLVSATGPGLANVIPIPTTVEFFPGVESHIMGPPFLGGPDADPSTVYNFEGKAGIAFVSGMVSRRNRRTGEVRSLPYLFNDMRFMQGRFKGRNGHVRDATFAFI